MIDSGVHASHPHVGRVAGGVAIRDDGTLDDDYVDRLGHGTAVAAAIREKAPEAGIIAVKVFWRSLATERLDAGPRDRRSGGARRRDRQPQPRHHGSRHRHEPRSPSPAPARPASSSLSGRGRRAAGSRATSTASCRVHLDWASGRESYRIVSENGRSIIAASGYPRDIPGIPRERNVNGISFAVANAAGFVARALEATPGAATSPRLFGTLARAAGARNCLG